MCCPCADTKGRDLDHGKLEVAEMALRAAVAGSGWTGALKAAVGGEEEPGASADTSDYRRWLLVAVAHGEPGGGRWIGWMPRVADDGAPLLQRAVAVASGGGNSGGGKAGEAEGTPGSKLLVMAEEKLNWFARFQAKHRESKAGSENVIVAAGCQLVLVLVDQSPRGGAARLVRLDLRRLAAFAEQLAESLQLDAAAARAANATFPEIDGRWASDPWQLAQLMPTRAREWLAGLWHWAGWHELGPADLLQTGVPSATLPFSTVTQPFCR